MENRGTAGDGGMGVQREALGEKDWDTGLIYLVE